MLIIILAFMGLAFGSFVNALVWRLHEQASKKSQVHKVESKKAKKTKDNSSTNDLSIIHGRSMCPQCGQRLSAKDLIPVVSWLSLGGKCRYCNKPISWQYPLVEITTTVLFATSYLLWPMNFDFIGIVNFVIWLVMLIGFMALIVYDLRWMLLPNRLVFPLMVLAAALGLLNVLGRVHSPLELLLSVVIAGGIFWGLFEISGGRWIGGGDVKLGLLIGLLLGDPYLAFLMLMTASILGTLLVLPAMLTRKVTPSSRIPFGPFLIIATILVQLFGMALVDWYKKSLSLG